MKRIRIKANSDFVKNVTENFKERFKDKTNIVTK